MYFFICQAQSLIFEVFHQYSFISKNHFYLTFGPENSLNLYGIFPEKSKLSTDELPALNGSVKLKKEQFIYMGRENNFKHYQLETKYDNAEKI